MTVLADVDGFKDCTQVCVWLGFRPLVMYRRVKHITNNIIILFALEGR